MKPTRIEFEVGATVYGQPVRLVLERGSAGERAWSIYRDEANQRDDREVIRGLPASVIERMAEAIKSVKT